MSKVTKKKKAVEPEKKRGRGRAPLPPGERREPFTARLLPQSFDDFEANRRLRRRSQGAYVEYLVECDRKSLMLEGVLKPRSDADKEWLDAERHKIAVGRVPSSN